MQEFYKTHNLNIILLIVGRNIYLIQKIFFYLFLQPKALNI